MKTKSKIFILEMIFGPNTKLLYPDSTVATILSQHNSEIAKDITKGEIPGVRVMAIESCLLLPSECLSDDELANLAENA